MENTLSDLACGEIDSWPKSATLLISSHRETECVTMRLRIGGAYVVAAGESVSECVWKLGRSYYDLIVGAYNAEAVIKAHREAQALSDARI